jgi:type IV pilus biogenesis protein CpaD/CtpE
MRGLALGVALLGLAGCYPPNALEMDYGNAVRNNIAQQVVNPQAGFKPKPAVGMSPQAAANEMERYDKTFREDPGAMKKQLEYQMKQQ